MSWKHPECLDCHGRSFSAYDPVGYEACTICEDPNDASIKQYALRHPVLLTKFILILVRERDYGRLDAIDKAVE